MAVEVGAGHEIQERFAAFRYAVCAPGFCVPGFGVPGFCVIADFRKMPGRRVLAALVMVAAYGALLFAVAETAPILMLGRAMIGLGGGGALMIGLKALKLRVARGRLTVMNGLCVLFAGMGAMAFTYAIGRLTDARDWRGAFCVLCVVAILASAVLLGFPQTAPKSTAARPGNRAITAP